MQILVDEEDIDQKINAVHWSNFLNGLPSIVFLLLLFTLFILIISIFFNGFHFLLPQAMKRKYRSAFLQERFYA